MKEGWWNRFKRKRKSDRYLVVPRQDATAEDQFEVIHEDSDLYNLYRGMVDDPEERIVDVPKKVLDENGRIDPEKAQILIQQKPGVGRVARLWLASDEE